tara:strand:+ start:61 stop:309 length:249 start_codon:yes stop_codon:yes gene_type:complete
MADGAGKYVGAIITVAVLVGTGLMAWAVMRERVQDTCDDIMAIEIDVDTLEHRQDRLEGRYDADMPWIRDTLGRIETKLDAE